MLSGKPELVHEARVFALLITDAGVMFKSVELLNKNNDME